MIEENRMGYSFTDSNESKVKIEAYMSCSLVDVVTDRIRDNIFSGKYRPGKKLVVREISEELGVSHTPVKDALNRLVSEGCVVALPRRSMMVKEYSTIEFIENYEIRLMLELFHADEIVAYAKNTPEILLNMKKYWSVMEGMVAGGNSSLNARWANAETGFHREYMKGCGNRRAYDTYCQLDSNKQSYLLYLGNNGQPLNHEFLATNNEEHKAVMEALSNQDSRLFCQTVYSHLIRSCESYVRDEETEKRFRMMKQNAEIFLKK